MTVLRIVTNVSTPDPKAAEAFYGDILGLDIAMDLGWIVTFAGDGRAAPQISFASEGGSGTEVPDISVEVTDVDDIYRKVVEAGFAVAYPLTDEDWGVRRFYVRDPFGRLVNILSHGTR